MFRRFVILSTLGLAACGGSHVCPDPAAVDPWGVRASSLEGEWTVVRADGVVDGTMVFVADNVEATSGETRLVGSWQLVETERALQLALRFDGAHRPGIDELWGEPTRVELELVFVDEHELLAMQSNGTFTRWTRQQVNP